MYESGEPVHPTNVDYVSRVSGPPPGHDQLLHQLPHLLLRLQAVQVCSLQHPGSLFSQPWCGRDRATSGQVIIVYLLFIVSYA